MALSALQTAVRNTCADGVADAVDVGTTDAGGGCNIYTSGHTTLLAEPQFGDPAFGAASSGTATANSITDDSSANNTGTAAALRIQDQDNATVVDGTVSTSGADLNLNTTAITSGDNVAVTSFTFTMPAS